MNYLDKIRHLNQRPGTDSTIQPGDLITWTRGDGNATTGTVDVLHVDDAGTRWAFCTLPDGRWSAMNVKYIRKVEASW
jgi:hypothetical protein